MREILFKAKRIDNGEWVEGYYYCMRETTYAIKEDYERNPVPTHHYILWEQMTDWGMPNQLYQTEIDTDTLCQYTGFTDKNGKKIWENDVVKCGGNLIVTWKENLASFCLRKNGWMFQHFFGEAVDAKDVEVIGNIFDNPELLEGGAE